MGTGIQWTDETWNPVTGCTKISAGCTNCFAERMTKRLQAMAVEKYAAGFGKVVCHPDALEIPLRWKKPRRVFVNSMSDLFHEDVPWSFQRNVFATMHTANQHTYQVLTKRPERMAEFITRYSEWCGFQAWPREYQHVWLGTTVENQATANERIPHLLKCPAAVRFLSCEPLLGSLDLTKVAWTLPSGGVVEGSVLGDKNGGQFSPRGAAGRGINWLIIGCESGPSRRPFKLEWARDIVEQCNAADLPVFVKQLRDDNDRVVHGPAEWPDWPEWARQEFPETKDPPIMKFNQKNPQCANPACRSRRTYKAFFNPADKSWRCHDCPCEFESPAARTGAGRAVAGARPRRERDSNHDVYSE